MLRSLALKWFLAGDGASGVEGAFRVHMSYGNFFWWAQRKWILYKDCSRAHNLLFLWSLTSTRNRTLVSMMLAVAHVRPGVGSVCSSPGADPDLQGSGLRSRTRCSLRSGVGLSFLTAGTKWAEVESPISFRGIFEVSDPIATP